jgi:hypothetical protein
MRKLWKYCVAFLFVSTMLFALSLSASAGYEPDGTTSVEYEFDAAECNRTLIINCVDENGTHLKTVQVQTKRGEDTAAAVVLYGYDIIAFESTQGLWETCTLSWTSGNKYSYAWIYIRYYFRTGLSQDSITATVTMRKHLPTTVKVRHFLRSKYTFEYGGMWYEYKEGYEFVTSYGDSFYCAAKDFEGHYLIQDREIRVETNVYPSGCPEEISGPFYYTMIEDAYGGEDIMDLLEWDVVDDDLNEEYKEYTTYSEEKDGKMGYAKNRVLYVDFYYDRSQHDAAFSANGGEGAPETITQYYDLDITIPETVPTREKHFFLGWSEEETATAPSYASGDTYKMKDSDVTFYAVWEKDDYEFSISDFSISEDALFPNSVLSVWLCLDSWDMDDAYSDIPVELYYDGVLLATEWIDFDIYGRVYLTFEIDVGTVVGEHTVEVQINRTGIEREEDPYNNTIQATFTIKPDEYAFGITPIENNAPYTEGMTVITSYLISNDSERDVLPDADTYVIFSAYYFDEYGTGITVDEQYWDGLAIPIGEQNLVYFKWTVPEDMAGVTLYCECTVNANGALKENNRDNNTATLTTVVADRVSSQTPNPSFTANAPSGYTPQSAPDESVGSASWTLWEYEDGTFVLKKYGIKIADRNPEITPDGNCTPANRDNGLWTMKSGYGITLCFAPALVVLNGCSTPDQSSYTDPQSAYATFSEYGYSTDVGAYRDLVLLEGEWYFAENEGADQNDRIHYIPLWLSDGEYIVSVTLTEIWTPVGRITAVRSSNVILIDGSLYDDWYN